MRDLAEEFQRLNDEQKHAVRHDGSTVVLAGPGSGKTATLVVKIAHLLSSYLTGPQGIACITFNNDAVTEFRSRLAEFGVHSGRTLFLGTVHSFCLNCILRPHARLVDQRFSAGVQVARPREAESLLQRAINNHIANQDVRWYTTTLTRFRRMRAVGEDTSGFDDRDHLIVTDYEALLSDRGVVDFEWMVLLALQLLVEHAWIREMVTARFPWLIVDEYQDLGGPLHQIVSTLVDRTAVKVFAVGDPDQTIYDFTGADPKYLSALSRRPDFESVRLRFNYRSGGDLIVAGQAALSPEEPRDYSPAPDREDRGRIVFVEAGFALIDHAEKAVRAVQDAIAEGVVPHEIAVFYQQKTQLLSELREAFDAAQIEYVAERDSKYPSAPVVRWLQSGAAWALAQGQDVEHTFEDLNRYFIALLQATGHIDAGAPELSWRTKLHGALLDTDPTTRLCDWVDRIDNSLHLRELLTSARDRSDEVEALDDLLETIRTGHHREAQVEEFAGEGRIRNKVVITTLHSSKGRQFDVVVIPGLAEGLLPRWRWDRRRRSYVEPIQQDLRSARRLFYVGFTRARHTVHLICSRGFINKGYRNNLGISRFAIEIAQRLRTRR